MTSNGLALAGVLVFASAPALAAENSPITPPQIAVSGTGTSAVAPDLARVRLTVRTEKKTARAALSENNQAVSNVITALTDNGIESRDLRTSGFSINPKISYYPKSSGRREEPKISGYTAQNTLTVTVRDLSKVGDILDQSVTLGVNQGGSLTFLNSNPEQAMETARIMAMKNAITKATTLAEAAGVGLGKILSISERSSRPQPIALMRGAAVQAAESVPVAAGENSYHVTVNVAWEIAQ